MRKNSELNPSVVCYACIQDYRKESVMCMQCTKCIHAGDCTKLWHSCINIITEWIQIGIFPRCEACTA